MTIPVTLVPDTSQTLQQNEIKIIKIKVKNRETLSYMDWITFKNHFVYNGNLSDKNSLLK